jgi:hypothetical protein
LFKYKIYQRKSEVDENLSNLSSKNLSCISVLYISSNDDDDDDDDDDFKVYFNNNLILSIIQIFEPKPLLKLSHDLIFKILFKCNVGNWLTDAGV